MSGTQVHKLIKLNQTIKRCIKCTQIPVHHFKTPQLSILRGALTLFYFINILDGTVLNKLHFQNTSSFFLQPTHSPSAIQKLSRSQLSLSLYLQFPQLLLATHAQ